MYFCLIIQITYLKIFKTRLNYVEVLHKLLGLVLIESIFNASAFCLTVLVTYFMYKQVNQLKKKLHQYVVHVISYQAGTKFL